MAGPLELAKQLNKSPFNEYRVSQEKGRETPSIPFLAMAVKD